jgi:aryl-alcohol dehydrogenase-like predicted oxidoreductase
MGHANTLQWCKIAPVEEREIGASGVRFSRVVLGGGNFGGIGSAPEFFGQGESEEDALRIMDAAWGLGITTFDTADAYGGGRSETAIGRWMRETGNRPTLTTKTFNPMTAGADHGLARRRMGRQLESSLERLGVDVVDLFLAHEFDPDVPVEELVETFELLRETGLIRAWGVSNFDGEQLRRVLLLGGRPALVQNSYSLLERGDERDVIPLCVEEDIAYEPFSPLAGGWLTGKYRRDEEAPAGSRMTQRPGPYEHLRTDAVFDGLDAFRGAAERRGVDMATLAFAWLLAQPGVTAVVTGPRRPEHLAPAVAALSVQLSADEAAELAALFPL